MSAGHLFTSSETKTNVLQVQRSPDPKFHQKSRSLNSSYSNNLASSRLEDHFKPMKKDVGVLLHSRRLQVGSGFLIPPKTKQTRPKKGRPGLLGWASATLLASQTLPLPPGEAPRPLLRQRVVVGVFLWSIKQHLSARAGQ